MIAVLLVVSPFLLFSAQGATVTQLSPSDDSWVEAERPDQNHGSETTLIVKSDAKTRRTYIKFDLNSIPPGKSITSAKLYLHCVSANPTSNIQVNVNATGDGWSESTITWNNAPSIGAFVASTNVGGANQSYFWDITSYAQTEYSGDKILSVVVKFPQDDPSQNNPKYEKKFASKEDNDVSVRPYLEIVYATTSPTASFTFSPSHPVANDTVTFNASASYDPDGSIVSYQWDFGDGNITTTSNPIITHRYSASAEYNVTLTVFDSEGKTDSTWQIVKVHSPPHASFTFKPDWPEMDEVVTFNATASYDSDGIITSYHWDFGDNTTTEENDPITTHIYPNPGDYTVKLTVTDNDGFNSSTTATVTVNPAILHVSLPDGTYVGYDPDKWLSEGWLLNINGSSGTFTLRINNTSGAITSYDTHLIIALNDAAYNNLVSLSVNGTPISKSAFKLGTPKPYNNGWPWPSGDVYPTWFNDTYIVGTIGPKDYVDLTISVSFSNATGVRMHFDAYGKRDGVPPPGNITHNPISEDSTVLFLPLVQYYLTIKTDPAGIVTIPGEGWYGNCTYVDLTAPQYVNVSADTRYRFDYWDVDGANVSGNPITVHMDANHTATAHYTLQYLVTFNQTGLDATAIGAVVTVNGAPKNFGNLPFYMWANNGSSVTYNYSAIVSSTVSGKRFRLDSVSGPSSPFTVTGPVTITGNYKTQYQLTVRTNGLGTNVTNVYNGTTPLGTATDATPYTNWFDEGSSLQLNIDSPITVGSTKFVFTQWSGDASGSVRPLSVTMDSAKDITANYKTQYLITFDQTGVGLDFTGVVVTIDGVDYSVGSLSTSFWWDAGSSHTFSFQSPLVVTPNAKRYVWISTSGLSSLQSGSINVLTSGSVIGNYKTQYYLTVTSPHDSPTPSSGWFDDGDEITASVTSPWPGATGVRYVCTGWTGTGSVPASGSTASVTFTINAPSSITWTWKTQYKLTVKTDPPGLSPGPTPPTGWYDESTDVTLTAQMVSGYRFNYWDVDGLSQGISVNPITVHMDNPHTATAHYQPVAPPPPVGGYALPINIDIEASNSLVPQIGLASTLSAAVAATIILVRRRKKTLKRKP